MTRHSSHKAQAPQRPGTFPARTARPARHARVTRLRQLASWLRPGWNDWPGRDDRASRAGRVGRVGRIDQAGQGGSRRGGRPRAAGSLVVLRDGSRVLVRPVRSADALLLADAFARLSETSRRMRFLGKKEELSAAELRYYAEVDHHDHEALIALDPASGRGVGVGRYVRDAGDPGAAEIALTVIDDWQGRGLGTELLARLSYRGRQEGICRFTGVVSAGNVPMGMLMRNVGAAETSRSFGTVEYEIALARAEEYSLDWWFRCVEDSGAFAWR
jgi:GNAT superfamily N-acetyltransferase